MLRHAGQRRSTSSPRRSATLEKALGHHAEGDAFDHAKHSASTSSRRWPRCAQLGDKLETIVADDLWPLPTYREMLFIK